MNRFLFDLEWIAPVMFWTAISFVLTMTAAVVVERAAFGVLALRQRRIEQRYRPLLQAALTGDETAFTTLVASPARHRVAIAWLLIVPLIADRDPRRLAASRRIAEALTVPAIARGYVRSRRWWRRALGLRALGLVQARDCTSLIVAALDDANLDVRAAALDALTDLHDPASLAAIVARTQDASLPIGRRAAALAAFGADCEPLLLDLAEINPAHRFHYARALSLCGTHRSRGVLCRWTEDRRADVRAAAFGALARVGLDADAARRATDALGSADTVERTMAARALGGWMAPDAAAALASHLDDAWPVAVSAAHSLRSMGDRGIAELLARSRTDDLAGLLARQALWQAGMRS